MKVVYVCLDDPREETIREMRCAIPARAINRTGKHSAHLVSLSRFAGHSPDSNALCRTADVIVVQRGFSGPALAEMQHWKAHDKVVVADFDSACYARAQAAGRREAVSPGCSDCAETVEGNPLPPEAAAGLHLIDAATAPALRILEDWRRYTPVSHLPNYLEIEHYCRPALPRREEIVIGWSGGEDPARSLAGSGLEAALSRVCQARPQVRVFICSPHARALKRLALPPTQARCQPWAPYAAWPQSLARFDIGLAPLEGEIDARRSWIRVLEYMVMKIPWVCSEGPAYQELRRYGWQVKNTASAWERILLDMVDHLDEYRAEAANEGYLFSLSQNADDNVDRILQTYAHIQETA